MKKIIYCLPLFLIITLFSGCDLIKNEKPASASSVTINMSGLVQLPDTALHYVLWVTNPNGKVPVKLAVLNPDNSGNISNLTIDAPSGKMQMAGEFWVTIQKYYSGTDSASNKIADSLNSWPSKNIVMKGNISGNSAALNMQNYVGTLSDVYMKYNLLTPTDSTNYNQLNGIWFADTLRDIYSPVSGTNISTAAGWVYRAVVEKDGQNLLIGEYTAGAPCTINAYGAGKQFFKDKYVGKILGGDFLANAPAGITFPLDLRSLNVSVYMLPFVTKLDGKRDSTYLNFTFGNKIFGGTIPSNASAFTTYSLQYLSPSLPQGTIKINLQI
jgi:hypothetical protein